MFKEVITMVRIIPKIMFFRYFFRKEKNHFIGVINKTSE